MTGMESLWHAHAELESYWRDTYAQASFMWNDADAWNTNMRDIKRRIDELGESGRLGVQVITGYLSPAKWKDIHHTLWDAVSGQAAINGNVPSLWSDFIVPTFTDVGAKLKEKAEDIGATADFLTSPMGLMLVLGVLMMLVVWRVSA